MVDFGKAFYMRTLLLHAKGLGISLILPQKCRLLNCSSATNSMVLQRHSKLVKILSEYQTAWKLMRLRITRHLIRIQAVCTWDYGCDRQDNDTPKIHPLS